MNKAEEKKEIVERMLAKGDTMLCIDSRHPGTQVPGIHQDKSDLRLILNLGFRHPVSVVPEGVQADLLFNGVLHHCWIPFESLWGVYDPATGEGALWPEQMPEDVLEAVGKNRTARGKTSPRMESCSTLQEEAGKAPDETSKAGSEAPPDTTLPQSTPALSAFDRRLPNQRRPGPRPSLRVLPGGKKD